MSSRRPAGLVLARALWWSAGAACVALTAHSARAQQSGDRPIARGDSAAHGLTLDDVLRAALRSNTNVLLGERQVELSRGAVIMASGAFDEQFSTSVSSGQDRTITPTGGEGAPTTTTLTNHTSYGVGLAKVFRSGLSVTPTVSVTRTALAQVPGAPLGRAAASLTLVAPLLKNRFGNVAVATERAAESEVRASALDLRHTTSSSAYDAIVAYWNYVAADKRLAVLTLTEERARRLLTETEALVRADERPASDLLQLRANLATKQSTRIGAEQAVVEARQALGISMGIDASAIPSLARATTDFPAVRRETATEHALPALVDSAVRHRSDLAAARQREQSMDLQARGARQDLRPQFDVVVTLGYAGLEQGNGVPRFFAPLYTNVPGMSASAQLRYLIPLANAASRGYAMQVESQLDQQRLVAADRARRVESGVVVATASLRNSRAGLAESDSAVTLSQATVDNEKRKFQLGMSTVFEVIQAEDALTNALIAQIAGQRNYAVALASVRFETGTLVQQDGDAPTVRTDVVTTPP